MLQEGCLLENDWELVLQFHVTSHFLRFKRFHYSQADVIQIGVLLDTVSLCILTRIRNWMLRLVVHEHRWDIPQDISFT